jgi:hypothetical protein
MASTDFRQTKTEGGFWSLAMKPCPFFLRILEPNQTFSHLKGYYYGRTYD